ncbi:MAG TPA: hypothetical protein VIR16_01005, partial [Candidatus Limnocylindrales bacterium]
SSVGNAPAYLLAGADTPSGSNVPVAFNMVPAGTPAPLPTLTPSQLQAAAKSLITTKPVKWVNPTGFPRVTPITQFDGGPLQNYNCTLASGAMLARLASGIVTDGSTLRSLQDKQSGGTSLNDLAQALWRGYGVSYNYGLVSLPSLKDLLKAGYGAVVQGVYGQVPVALRLQADFTGGHAIYLDGYYPGDAAHGIPEAYYVIDPLGRSWAGYEGDWWPAAAVDAFLTAFSGGNRASAMWAYPPGGTPPQVVNPDVLPMPPDPPTTGTSSPSPSGSAGASGSVTPSSAAPSASGSSPSLPVGSTPPWSGPYLAGETAAIAHLLETIRDSESGGLSLVPFLDICVVEPRPAGCPTGLPATVILNIPPAAIPPPGPTVTVQFVDSPTSNTAIVGFTVDPPTMSDVRFWAVGVSPAAVGSASAETTAQIDGKTVVLARLDVAASTEYQFQVVAGSGTASAVSPIGDFKTGSGVAQFDVSLGSASSPSLGFGTGLSPYLHVPSGGFVPPMVATASPDASCADAGTFGGKTFCLSPATITLASCPTASVTYALSGLDATGVLIRAYPQGGSAGVAGTVEAAGPTPSGTVSVGCLTSGLTYTVALYAQGNDQGVLAQRTLSVP